MEQKLDFGMLDDINSTVMGLMEDLDPNDDEAGKDDIEPDSEDLWGEADDWKRKYPSPTGDVKKATVAIERAKKAVDANDFDHLTYAQADLQDLDTKYDPRDRKED